jgi:hypothetical protein
MSCLDVHSNLWETSSVFDSDFSGGFEPINCQGTFCNCRGPKCLRRLTGLHRVAAPADICPKKWGYLEDPMDYHGLSICSIHGIVMVPTDLLIERISWFQHVGKYSTHGAFGYDHFPDYRCHFGVFRLREMLFALTRIIDPNRGRDPTFGYTEYFFWAVTSSNCW